MNDDPDPRKNWITRIGEFFIGSPRNRQQFQTLLQKAKEHHVLDNESFRMIEGVLQVSQMQVRDVMVPGPQMVVVEGEFSPEQALPTISESGHSRFPVIGENRDEILGILLAKDLLKFIPNQTDETVRISNLVRPATFVPESKRLDVLLKEFRANRNHMAMVVDEYGGIAGLVTIEDVLEEIVGEIEDEYDLAETDLDVKKIGKNEYLVKALTSIEDFNEFFHTDYKHDDFDTIGGLILQHFAHLPKKGESITLDSFKITVVQASNRGIALLRVTK